MFIKLEDCKQCGSPAWRFQSPDLTDSYIFPVINGCLCDKLKRDMRKGVKHEVKADK